ncbi:phage repressor protein CI [Phytobacter sp. V91]|uniref:phage repressor protein CI n=1 Tax=Phytobacter sp. V91 TaxID=3369425 RepID=UPI003F62E6D4
MRDSKDSAQNILSRMKEAFGVDSGVELAERMSIPKSTVSNWVSRDSIPFRYVLACARITGKDIDWLLTGKLANASFGGSVAWEHKESLHYGVILKQGGKAILHRLLLAYGFTMQKQLGDLLGLSSGTISTWVRRDYFPGDVVVACALDTGVSLRWLATGLGATTEHTTQNEHGLIKSISFDKYELQNGLMVKQGKWVCDTSLIPDEMLQPALICKGESKWIADLGIEALGNGTWIINIDGVADVYEVSRLPGNKVNISNSITNFQCSVSDVVCVGKVFITLTKNQ